MAHQHLHIDTSPSSASSAGVAPDSAIDVDPDHHGGDLLGDDDEALHLLPHHLMDSDASHVAMVREILSVPGVEPFADPLAIWHALRHPSAALMRALVESHPPAHAATADKLLRLAAQDATPPVVAYLLAVLQLPYGTPAPLLAAVAHRVDDESAAAAEIVALLLNDPRLDPAPQGNALLESFDACFMLKARVEDVAVFQVLAHDPRLNVVPAWITALAAHCLGNADALDWLRAHLVPPPGSRPEPPTVLPATVVAGPKTAAAFVAGITRLPAEVWDLVESLTTATDVHRLRRVCRAVYAGRPSRAVAQAKLEWLVSHSFTYRPALLRALLAEDATVHGPRTLDGRALVVAARHADWELVMRFTDGADARYRLPAGERTRATVLWALVEALSAIEEVAGGEVTVDARAAVFALVGHSQCPWWYAASVGPLHAILRTTDGLIPQNDPVSALFLAVLTGTPLPPVFPADEHDLVSHAVYLAVRHGTASSLTSLLAALRAAGVPDTVVCRGGRTTGMGAVQFQPVHAAIAAGDAALFDAVFEHGIAQTRWCFPFALCLRARRAGKAALVEHIRRKYMGIRPAV
ncbi:hypothetical protein H9P43_000134 [Blastocladiella emersonii ATCC 22665]|nr:hypothetical protein H9P43_000134 [Blastocladiella emersonii ATCC 22665]